MITRCLFKLNSIQEFDTTYNYSLAPVTSGAPENKAFWEYTPSGSLSLTIMKKLGKLFEFGKEYYLDITTKEAQ